MLQNYKYRIERNEVIIYPYLIFKTVGLIMLATSFLAMLAILLPFYSLISAAAIKTFIVLILLMIIVFSPFFIISNRQIIFEGIERKVFKKNIFGKKHLINFSEIGEIALTTIDFRKGYFLMRSADRFGKGIYIGPQGKNNNELENKVIPEIKNMLQTSIAGENLIHSTKDQISDNNLSFYTQTTNRFIVKGSNQKTYLIPFIIISVIWIWLLYHRFVVNSHEDIFYALIPAVPFTLLLANLTQKSIFDISSKLFIVKYLGITMQKEKIEDFINFKITRRTTNGIYSGTNIKLLFATTNNKEKASFPIYDFKKTHSIEQFIDETRYVINKIK